MSGEELKRRLATIVVADVVGYSRLMADDETGTIAALEEYRTTIDAIIARYDGRIFKTGGDSVLVDFPSPVDAVRCAVDWQEAVRSRNLVRPVNRHIRFRIGINLGDVMVRGGDLLGDGVNVAARLEALADPGGICVSGTVWDQIEGKLSVGRIDMGEQSVKNIPRPVRAYQLRTDGDTDLVLEPARPSPSPPARAAPVRLTSLALTGTVAATALAVVLLYEGLRFRSEPRPSTEPATAASPMAAASPTGTASSASPPATGAPAPTAPPAQTANASPAPGTTFRDCPSCPEMVVVPAGRFQMGAEPAEHDRYAVPPERASRELPRHTVTISRAFALGKYEVTRQEFAAFVQDAGYEVPPGCDEWSGSRWVMQPGKNWRQPGFPQTDRDPVVCVNGDDAAAYLRWLTQKTGRPYRLPSEAEWEYAARGGTTTPFYWGGEWTEACRFENIADQSTEARGWKNINPCRDGYIYTAPVGSFQANPFGLFDMLGNAVELTADCRNDSYAGAPADGSPWTSGNCTDRIARGGARTHGEAYWVRAANRLFERYRGRLDQMGFRVALSPP